MQSVTLDTLKRARFAWHLHLHMQNGSVRLLCHTEPHSSVTNHIYIIYIQPSKKKKGDWNVKHRIHVVDFSCWIIWCLISWQTNRVQMTRDSCDVCARACMWQDWTHPGLPAVIFIQDVQGVQVRSSAQQPGRQEVTLETEKPADPPGWNRSRWLGTGWTHTQRWNHYSTQYNSIIH